MPNKITLKYKINGCRFVRHYALTAAEAALSRAAVLVTNGIPVLMRGMPRLLPVHQAYPQYAGVLAQVPRSKGRPKGAA